jgi:hypothetical protein
MPDEAVLRQKVRDALERGRLPARSPDRTWSAGAGRGTACAVCELPVQHHQLEFMVQFLRDGTLPSADLYLLHVPCLPWPGGRRSWTLRRGESGPSSAMDKLNPGG